GGRGEHHQASLRSDQRSPSPEQVFTFLRNKRSPSPEYASEVNRVAPRPASRGRGARTAMPPTGAVVCLEASYIPRIHDNVAASFACVSRCNGRASSHGI